ncbi:histidinol-phosphatase [Phaeosphaeriaceae sp. PMI808]|nr:histidinol-phosphatase [Phaeosphaeriaceae sp. PMI808]
MPYSHHSHSGQFCGHAKNTLEEVVQTAIAKGFHTFALTEHMPRPFKHFYPGERNTHTEETLAKLFDDFYVEANRLRKIYANDIQILIGFESEYIEDSTIQLVKNILDNKTFDFFVGSIHHTHAIPIDFDRVMYEQARDKAGGTDESLFEDYFDEQFVMLQALKPPVVGHFDLIRLLSDHRDGEFKDMTSVWEKIERNLNYVASYGGRLELNSSGLRKGLAEPYPCRPICQMFLRLGGGFVMSDDSHGIDQVGTNYAPMLSFIREIGITEIQYVDPNGVGHDHRFPKICFSSITTSTLVELLFWETI